MTLLVGPDGRTTRTIGTVAMADVETWLAAQKRRKHQTKPAWRADTS